MRLRLYHFLVNRHAGIRARYIEMHDRCRGAGRILSWLYLLWLNFAFYVLHCRSVGKTPTEAFYEQKRIRTDQSESDAACGETPRAEELAERLAQYDVISLDIFDTLIFRPFSEPADLFYFVGKKLVFMDFKRIRMECESKARRECYRRNGHYEATFSEIWDEIRRETGIPSDVGMETELEMEKQFCYANPYMLRVVRELFRRGKRVIAVSDMYLPAAFLGELLEKNGYEGIGKVFVSCEYGANKGTGDLYERVKEEMGKDLRYVHVGDNPASDIRMAEKHGFEAAHYPNVNRNAKKYRPYDMSPVVGGAYRGIVDNHLYQGLRRYSMEYEYGFVYGGLFVLGYCNFIHGYCRHYGADRILFLSRDGDILKQAYDRMFPGEDTVYAYWSRRAGVKLMAGYDQYDFFRRFLYHNINQDKSIQDILCSMELRRIADKLEKDPFGQAACGFALTDVLTDKNVDALKTYLRSCYGEVLESYRGQREAAETYYRSILGGCRHAAVVDIGWAGSGALSLSWLTGQEWGLPCKVTGIVAGTNTVHNAEPDASEAFFQSRKLVSYLFSQSHNRDMMKKHDINKDYNVFWELLLSSPTPRFCGFYEGKVEAGEGLAECVYDSGRDITFGFGDCDVDPGKTREIQRGILDFVEEYQEHFRNFPYMFDISGRDAGTPMLLAASYNEKYLKEISGRFHLEKGIR